MKVVASGHDGKEGEVAASAAKRSGGGVLFVLGCAVFLGAEGRGTKEEEGEAYEGFKEGWSEGEEAEDNRGGDQGGPGQLYKEGSRTTQEERLAPGSGLEGGCSG